MRNHAITSILILAFVLGLSVTPSITASSSPLGFLSVKGTWIVDASGRVVLLRGVNYPGYQSAGSDPKPHKESAYETLARFGINVVRLPISWANIEPVPGMFYESYFSYYVDRDVRWAKKYGLYIVFDMHQDNWAAKFGGVGAPDWAVEKYPPTEIGMRQAISDFWNNTTLQNHLTLIWSKIAARYANEPAVAGYDILNEPWIFSSINSNLTASHVDAFYMKVIKAIRSVDQHHIIFLEPANMRSKTFNIKDNIVWSPHYYPLSFAPKYYPQNITVLEADLAAKYKTFVLGMGSPMWIGEFGAFMKDPSSTLWLQDTVKLFTKYQVGSAYWAFHGSSESQVLAALFTSS